MMDRTKRISIHIGNKDRHSELFGLLLSLKYQSYQDFDIVIVDESQTPLVSCGFLMKLIQHLKMQNHGVKIVRNPISTGVCAMRNLCVKEDEYGNAFTCRLDDDVFLEGDYLERLMKVIESGYDLASGVTPTVGQPVPKRETKFVKPIINRLEWDDKGEIVNIGDDCGYRYLEDEIIPTHHLRSCFLYKSEINKFVSYETNLSPVGFREEAFFSLRCAWLGYTLAVDTQATAWHLQCPSGGCRYPDYPQKVQQDNQTFLNWFKKMVVSKGNPFEVKQ